MKEIDLFTCVNGRPCIHLATETIIIIKSANWYNGNLNYNCLIPEINEKGKLEFCSASYSETEIILI